jgi:hypothetical protein
MADIKNNSKQNLYIEHGGDMWRDYKTQYGIIAAYCICYRYLKMQMKSADESERVFCRQLQYAMDAEPAMTDVGVYRHSEDYAKLEGAVELFENSYKINNLCAGDIDEAINACSYGDGSVDYSDALTALTVRYGTERLRFVLGSEIQWDSPLRRYPDELYKWAREMYIHESYGRFGVRTRPEYLAGLISEFRQSETTNKLPTHERGGEQGGRELDNKIDFYISFYEQLAMNGFQAYKSFDKGHIADICVNGYNIAHFTKTDTIEPNPYAEGVEPGTIDRIRGIMNETALRFNVFIGDKQFSDKELSAIHNHLIKMRILPDNDLPFNETRELDAIIGKIEKIVPELSEHETAAAHENENDLSEGVEV